MRAGGVKSLWVLAQDWIAEVVVGGWRVEITKAWEGRGRGNEAGAPCQLRGLLVIQWKAAHMRVGPGVRPCLSELG